MMKRIVSLLLVLCLSLLCVSALAEQPAEENAHGTSAMSVIPENALSVLDDHPGTLPLYFTGNPTTGYDWYFSILDDSIVSIEAGYDTEDTESVGAGGLYGFFIKGLKAGDTMIAFEYCQGFDPDAVSYVNVMYFVNVDENLNVKITSSTVGFD